MIIDADLRARIEALSTEDRLAVLASIVAPFHAARRAFDRGEMTEREFLAIGIAVNRAAGEFPGGPGPLPSIVGEAEMLRRIAELDREKQ